MRAAAAAAEMGWIRSVGAHRWARAASTNVSSGRSAGGMPSGLRTWPAVTVGSAATQGRVTAMPCAARGAWTEARLMVAVSVRVQSKSKAYAAYGPVWS